MSTPTRSSAGPIWTVVGATTLCLLALGAGWWLGRQQGGAAPDDGRRSGLVQEADRLRRPLLLQGLEGLVHRRGGGGGVVKGGAAAQAIDQVDWILGIDGGAAGAGAIAAIDLALLGGGAHGLAVAGLLGRRR